MGAGGRTGKKWRGKRVFAAGALLIGAAMSGGVQAIPIELEVINGRSGNDVYSLVHYDVKVCKRRNHNGRCTQRVFVERTLDLVGGQTLTIDYDLDTNMLSLFGGPQSLDLIEYDGTLGSASLNVESFDFDLNDNGRPRRDNNDFEGGTLDFTLSSRDFTPQYGGTFTFGDMRPGRRGVFNSTTWDGLNLELFAWGGDNGPTPNRIKNVGIDIGGNGTPVPTPGTLALLGAGLVGFSRVRRRRPA